ncbi:MAG: hypothetical protein E7491_07040 [Ruminococcaceae bacterium]|nr:hypothetical protein [Oscillospiraceae bacterium]
MKKTRFLAVLLSVVMLLSILPIGMTTSAASLILMQLDTQYAGTEITVAGLSSHVYVSLEIYKPNATSPFISENLTIAPNGAYGVTFTLDANVFGQYKAVAKTEAERTEMVFNVVEKTAENEQVNKDFEITNDYSEEYVGGIRVYVDGDAHKYSIDCYEKNGDVMVPLKELCGVIDIELSEIDGGWFLKKGLIELTLKEGSTAAEKLDRAVDVPETLTMPVSVEKYGDTLVVPVKFISDAFEWHNTYDAKAGIFAVGTREKDEWFYKFPTQAESSVFQTTDSKSVRANFGADFTWGLLMQRANAAEAKGVQDQVDALGLKKLSYFESAGQITLPTIAYKSEDFSKSFNSHAWSLGGNPAAINSYSYFSVSGLHLEINNDVTTREIATRESLGYSEPKYPDGSSALGYLTGTDYPYPLTAKLYDSAAAKGADGKILVTYDTLVETDGKEKLPIQVTVGSSTLRTLAGYNEGDVASFLFVNMAKDILAPVWREHARVTVREMINNGMDGMWCDNYGPWDNFASIKNCFGDWSEALFNEYLKSRHTAAELAEMGISDIDSFNIREYVVNTAIDYFGDADLIAGYEHIFLYSEASAAYQETFWLDNILWNAYKTFKASESFKYIQDIYEIIKEEAYDAGLEEGYFVLGNDSPGVSHGFVESDYLDAVGAEFTNGWNLSMGSKGMQLLPEGRVAIFYKVANEFGSAPYCVPWFYSGGNAALKETNASKILLAEAFANNAFINAATNHVGNNEAHRWLNNFIYKNEEVFGTRYTKADIAIIFSTENQLANMNTNYLNGANIDRQYHVQGVWGTSYVLAKANIPYAIIPEWQANPELLANYKTVVIPNLEAMSDEMYKIYTDYANNGGRLVITGAMGYRYGGDDGYFMQRDTALITELLGVDVTEVPKNDLNNSPSTPDDFVTAQFGEGTITWCDQPLGNLYMTLTGADYREMLSKIIIAMCGNNKTLLDQSTLPDNVGAYLLQSKDGQQVFVDLVNYNVDLADDSLKTIGKFSVKVKLPAGLTNVTAQILSPEGNYDAAVSVADGWATVTVDKLDVYSSVKISGTSTKVQQTLNGEPSAWAKEEIIKALEADLVPAHVNSNYTTDITRSDFCDLIIKMIEKKSGKAIADVIAGYADAKAEVSFPDTDSANVIAAAKLGIVNGRASGAFDPTANITRQEAAKMLALAAKVLGADITASEVAFADADDIYAWAKEFIYYVNTIGVMNGTSTTTPPNFSPLRTYTREQSILTVYRLFNAL